MIFLLLTHVDFGFQCSQRLRELRGTFVHALLQLVVSLAQFIFGVVPLTGLGRERIDDLVQAQLFAAVGLAERDENGAHQEATNHGVKFGLAEQGEGVAGIDEPVEDSQKTKKAAQDGRREAAYHRTERDHDVQGDVESDMPE